ncbi:hypothetical protein VTH06DRAFT_764 [Thermothelomyces fergusii]
MSAFFRVRGLWLQRVRLCSLFSFVIVAVVVIVVLISLGSTLFLAGRHVGGTWSMESSFLESRSSENKKKRSKRLRGVLALRKTV